MDYISQALASAGFSPTQVSGISAGVFAESGGNPSSVNPSSGAFGIGQWLGQRKANLFALYGPNPTLGQQTSFLIQELLGGDPGGTAVLNANSPTSVLSNYITKFMRPAAGAETSGDIQRGTAYLMSSPTKFSGAIFNGATTSLNGSGRAALIQQFGPTVGGAMADALDMTGNVLGAPGRAIEGVPLAGDVKDVMQGQDPKSVLFQSWFPRIGYALLAIVLIAAALFTMKGSRQVITNAAAVAA